VASLLKLIVNAQTVATKIENILSDDKEDVTATVRYSHNILWILDCRMGFLFIASLRVCMVVTLQINPYLATSTNIKSC